MSYSAHDVNSFRAADDTTRYTPFPGIQGTNAVSIIRLTVVVIVHFVLTVWASMYTGYLPPAYQYMNLFILAFGAYAILYPENTESVSMLMILNVISIVMDIIFIAIFQPIANSLIERPIIPQNLKNGYRFSLGMSIANLIIKPVTSFLLYRIHQERGGSYSDLGIPGIPNFSGRRDPYEDIERTGGIESANQSVEKSYDPPLAHP